MAKKFFTRQDIQEILETNPLKAKVFYMEREEKSSPDNVILYYRLTPGSSITADDRVHMRKVTVQVSHYHKKKLDSIVEHYLKAVGLWEEVKDRLKSPASKLSGGQQQRLCLARSLAVEPSYLLADESTSALDPISSKKVEQLFTELKKDYSIVMVTHTLRQALRIADHVIFMYLGEVIEEGSAEEVFHHPKHELTQEYLNGAFS